MVVFVTVRPSLSLKEAGGAQLRLTLRTHKVLGVPHFTQRRDHLQKRREKCSTKRTMRGFYRIQLYKADFASFFVKSTIFKCLLICLCGLLYLSHNAFVAGSTVAFGRGAYANLLQVGAQPS